MGKLKTKIKDNRGGARRTIDPLKGKSENYTTTLYKRERDFLIKKYGTLPKALRTLLPDDFWDDPHGGF